MLPSEYHLTFKIRSTTRPACTNLDAGKDYVPLFYSGSFAEEVTQHIYYHKPSFIETSNIVNIILMENL